MEFESKLRDLLGQYGYSLKNVIAILYPQAASSSKAKVATGQEKVSRKPRQVKLCKNPHSGEIVETKGGNHKTLKLWKSEYGSDVVESWVS
jgi:hypothetical protein